MIIFFVLIVAIEPIVNVEAMNAAHEIEILTETCYSKTNEWPIE